MTTNELRDALRTLQAKGRIKHFTETERGVFLVTPGAGPLLRVRTQRDFDGLTAVLIRREAGVR